MMLASIIIATYNREKEVCNCIESITLKTLEKNNTEIVVVDDCSTDGTVEKIKTKYPHVKVLTSCANKGPSMARNLAVVEATGGLLIFLDSDAIVLDGWLDTMLSDHDGKTVLIGHVLESNTGVSRSGSCRSTFIGRRISCSPAKANSAGAGNLAFPATLFNKLNGFDKELPFGFEDSDLCIRAKLAGANFKYLERAVVRHMGCGTIREGAFLCLNERNCVYAMLKTYRNSFLKIIIFLLLTFGWVLFRVLRLSIKMKFLDAFYIFKGFFVGIKNFCAGKNV